MALRQVAILGLLGGAAYIVWRGFQQGVDAFVTAPVLLSPDNAGSPVDMVNVTAPTSDYLAALAKAENPSGDPYAKNPHSTASGLYQFERATWIALGGAWGNDPTKAFGGLRPSVAEQNARAAQLTKSNASVLSRLGTAVDNISLYAAHIFGGSKAAGILTADPSTPLTSFVSANTVKINPALGTTVGSLLNYLTRKVG